MRRRRMRSLWNLSRTWTGWSEQSRSIKDVSLGLGLLELRVFRPSSDEDGDVGVGVFPQREEILISRLGLGGVALQDIGSADLEMRECAPRKVHHQSSMVDELLKFRCRSISIVQHQIGFTTQINRAQDYREAHG